MAEDTPQFRRPSAPERLFGKLLVFLVRLGIVRGHFYVLEVKGRKSGRTITLPVDPLDWGWRRFLVCPRGQSQWVQNVRATQTVALVRAMRRRHYDVRELPIDERPPILKAYLDHFAGEVQRFFTVPKGSPVDAFEPLAERYPVFELTPTDPPP
jgi:hypothetical protein